MNIDRGGDRMSRVSEDGFRVNDDDRRTHRTLEGPEPEGTKRLCDLRI